MWLDLSVKLNRSFVNTQAATECWRKTDLYQLAAGAQAQYWSKADLACQSRTPEVSELAPGAEVQDACPETKGHHQSRRVSDLNIPNRRAYQGQALMNRWGLCSGSRETRRSPVSLPGLHPVQVTGGV